MRFRILLKKIAWSLSLGFFLWAVGLGVYIAIYCPTIVRTTADGNKASVLLSYFIIGCALFTGVWVFYGIVCWVVIAPFLRMSDGFKGVSKIKIDCPKCGCSLKGAKTNMIGDIGVCPKCRFEFVIGQMENKNVESEKNSAT